MIDAQDREILLDHEKLDAEKKKLEADYAEHQKMLDDWRDVLGRPSGRRVTWDLLGLMGFQKQLFNTDSLIMAANCGQYTLALSLLNVIEEALPGITFKMQNEFRKAQARDK